MRNVRLAYNFCVGNGIVAWTSYLYARFQRRIRERAGCPTRTEDEACRAGRRWTSSPTLWRRPSFPESSRRGPGWTNNISLNAIQRSEEHTSELQSLMRISYAVFCLKKKKKTRITHHNR